MALVSSGHFAYPWYLLGAGSAAAWAITDTTFVLDASGEYVAMVFRAPKAGNLRKFACRLGTIGNTPNNGLRFSFQGVSVTTGLPDGGVDQFATIPSGSEIASAWNDPGNFDADRAVVRGEVVAAVIDFPSFVAGDLVRVASTPMSGIQPRGTDYGVQNGAKVSGATRMMMAAMYDDNTWVNLDSWSRPISSITSPTFNVDSATADEYGLSFTLPGPSTCIGIQARISMALGGVYELLLYEGTTVRRTATIDGDILGLNSHQECYVLWDDGPFSLRSNVTYTVAVRPTDTTNAVISYSTFPSAAVVGAMPGGNNIYLSRRLDQGAWTHFNNDTDGYARPYMSAILSAFDDGSPYIIGG